MLMYEHFLKLASKEFKKDGERRKFAPDALEELTNAVPLIFAPKEGKLLVPEYDQTMPLDLPFKTCFFEMLGGYSIINANGHLLCGIYVNEVGPREYNILSLYIMPNGENEIHYISNPDVVNHYINVIAELLRRLYTEAVGQSNPRIPIKIKSEGIKVKNRIRKVVYITPKKNMESLKASMSREIHWEYKWKVRGHWRSIPKRIGKDRDGNIQMNFTWVTEYIKGPEDAILIEKPRIVRN